MSELSKKYFFTYEESDESGAGPKELLEKILADPELPALKEIIIGYWGECYEDSPQPIIDGIIEHKDQFAHIESLYIGEMDYEECEVSWIIQGDYSGLFAALPGLTQLRIKGAEGLVLGKGIRHENLKKFEIICGGLMVSVIQDIRDADFPALESLILYLGEDSYGFDAGPDDLKELLEQGKFPALKHLGLVDSEIQDQLPDLIAESRLAAQLEELELSYGVLTDEGGQHLLDCADRFPSLKRLEISYHYMTDGRVKKLQELPFEVIIDDPQGADSEYKYPILTE